MVLTTQAHHARIEMFRIINSFRNLWSAKELSSEPDLNDPEGLQVVSMHDEDDEDEEASVDIVAVHGLGGHPYDTWTHDNGIMWLRDLLPQDIPNARVMTWGYDSEPQTAKHFIHMMTFSHPDNLLSALYSLRSDTKSNNRPIIFMCHNLGGIVVKEALMRASMAIPQNKKQLKSIQNCTKGVIFFGTPQQSTQQISFGKTIRRLASVALSRESLLPSLETASNRLELQLEQFKSLCTSLTNYYCYERWPTRTPLGINLVSIQHNPGCCEANMEQMMSKASVIGSLCTGDSRCVGLDKDHMNMVKYPDSEDQDYKLVVDLVCRIRKSNSWMKPSEWQGDQSQSEFLSCLACVIHTAGKDKPLTTILNMWLILWQQNSFRFSLIDL